LGKLKTKEMQTDLDIQTHKLIVERATALLIVSKEQYKSVIEEIISYSKNIIDNYNGKSKTVIDASKTEEGRWISSIKKIIIGVYLNPYIKKHNLSTYGNKYHALRTLVKAACDKTNFSTYLKNSYLFLHREMFDPYNPTPLEKAINESIRTQIIIEFSNQNIELITKLK
jgi:predicted RNA-binding protein YlqC (UPF0109 family)